MFAYKVGNPASPHQPWSFTGFSPKIFLLCGTTLTSESRCVWKTCRNGGEASTEGIFLPWNEVWWRHTEVVQNQVTSPADVAELWGCTGIGCDFLKWFCVCLVGDTLTICTLHSFGRCTSIWNTHLHIYACIAIVYDFTSHAMYFSLDSVWVFRQCLIFFQI